MFGEGVHEMDDRRLVDNVYQVAAKSALGSAFCSHLNKGKSIITNHGYKALSFSCWRIIP